MSNPYPSDCNLTSWSIGQIRICACSVFLLVVIVVAVKRIRCVVLREIKGTHGSFVVVTRRTLGFLFFLLLWFLSAKQLTELINNHLILLGSIVELNRDFMRRNTIATMATMFTSSCCHLGWLWFNCSELLFPTFGTTLRTYLKH